VGDGKTLDTAAITKAILAVTDAGWGTVLFPVCMRERKEGRKEREREKDI
jgi:polygalacturonase